MKPRKILVINNETGAIEDLKKSLKGEDFEIVHFKKFNPKSMRGFTHIILTGGDHWPRKWKFSKEMKLVKNSNVPILGICLGMQIIAVAFRSKMKHLKKLNKGSTEINIMKKDRLFGSLPGKIRGFEFRGYAVKKLGENIEIIAESKLGIEAIRHKNKKIWGVQFHPEVKVDAKNQGKKIIQNFLTFN